MPNVTQSSLHLMGLTDPSHHQMLPPPPHSTSLLHSQHSPHYTPTVVGSPQAQQRHTPPNNSGSSNTSSNNSGNSNKFPPPLIPVNGTSRYSSAGGVYGSGADVIDLSSPPQSPHRPNMGNGRNSSTNNNDQSSPCGRKLIQIGETSTSGSHIPYQVGRFLSYLFAKEESYLCSCYCQFRCLPSVPMPDLISMIWH